MNNIIIVEDRIGWGDCYYQFRKNIANKIALFLSITYGNDFLRKEDIIIRPLSTHKMQKSCRNNLTYPCSCPGRKNICIASQGSYWCQFVYQLSHEFCHCITAQYCLPQSVRWFDEFLACFTSLLVMDYLSKDDLGIRNLYNHGFSVAMNNYLNQYLSAKQNYETNTCELFSQNQTFYMTDENFIKSHEEYARKLFYYVRNNYSGLTFIGKIRQLEMYFQADITEFFILLKNICNYEEQGLIDYIFNEIFGLKIVCTA